MIPLPDRRFMQMAWVVPDIHAAMAVWTRSTGVGPFFMFDKITWDNPVYRGKPWGGIDITAAIAQAGDVQIELITQNEECPSMFRDIVPAGQTGFHHMGLYSNDYDADLAAYTKAGAEVAFSGLMMGNRVCWLETRPSLGFMIELIQANPVASSIFAQFRAAAENWDGKNPVRSLS